MPRTTPTCKPPTRGPTGMHAQKNPKTYINPSEQDMHPYIERYLCGDSLREIAKDLGISYEQVRRRIIKWSLTGKADKSYADMVTDLLVDRIATADMHLEDALSMCDITRADKICRYARMDFERRRPHLYGQRAEITFTGPAAVFLGLTNENPLQLNAPPCIQIEQAAVQADPDNVG